MSKKHLHPQRILVGKLTAFGLGGMLNSGTTVVATNVTPHDQLQKDGDGFTVHSGGASGGQAVNSVRSRIHSDHVGVKKHSVTLLLSNGGKMTIPIADAEVCFAQLLPELAAINQGVDSTARA